MRSKIVSFIKPVSPSWSERKLEAERPSTAAQPRRRKADEPSSFSGIKVPAPVENKSRVGSRFEGERLYCCTYVGSRVSKYKCRSEFEDCAGQKCGSCTSAKRWCDRKLDSPFGNYLVPVKSPLPS